VGWCHLRKGLGVVISEGETLAKEDPLETTWAPLLGNKWPFAPTTTQVNFSELLLRQINLFSFSKSRPHFLI